MWGIMFQMTTPKYLILLCAVLIDRFGTFSIYYLRSSCYIDSSKYLDRLLQFGGPSPLQILTCFQLHESIVLRPKLACQVCCGFLTVSVYLYRPRIYSESIVLQPLMRVSASVIYTMTQLPTVIKTRQYKRCTKH